MQIQITGKKLDVSESLRRQSEEKIQDVSQKYDLRPLECSITFSKDGPLVKCDIEMHLGRGVYVRANQDTNDAYLSLDQAIDTSIAKIRGALPAN